MNLKQLLEAQNAINLLINARGLPSVTQLRLARFWRTVKPELEAYEAERLRLAADLGELNEARTEYLFPDPEKRAAFNEQVAAMQNEEIALTIRPFDVTDFKNAGLSVLDILALEATGLLVMDWDALDEGAD